MKKNNSTHSFFQKTTDFLMLLFLVFVSINANASGTDDFITTWQTTAANESITIPTIGGGYNYDVDWGDGNTTTGHTANATHQYAVPGNHTVIISGTFPRIYFNYLGDREKITSIDQWGTGIWTSMESAFQGCTNLAGQASDAPDLSLVTDMQAMFFDASSFNQDIGNWNVENVTNMWDVFFGASSFNQDIGIWNMGNVTNMQAMFFNASSFNQNIGNWNVGNVTNMSGVFFNAAAFNQNIGNWDVGNVANMHDIFFGASSFNQDIGNWTVGNVENMQAMFYGASSFNQDIGNWNVENVTNMSGMFLGSSSFDQDLGNWNVENVTNMQDMFNGIALSTANYDALLIGWNAQNLQNGVTFSGGNSNYCAGESARYYMGFNHGWFITDGGRLSTSGFIWNGSADNNWSNPANWDGGCGPVPDAGDKVTINAGNVIVDAPVTVDYIIINGGTLTVATGQKLTVTKTNPIGSHGIVNHGEIIVDGILEIHSVRSGIGSNLNDGLVTNNGTINIHDLLNQGTAISGGDFYNYGTFSATNIGYGIKAWQSILENHGSISISQITQTGLLLSSNSDFTNTTSGTIITEYTAKGIHTYQANSFMNHGLIQMKHSVHESFEIYDTEIHNYGTIQIDNSNKESLFIRVFSVVTNHAGASIIINSSNKDAILLHTELINNGFIDINTITSSRGIGILGVGAMLANSGTINISDTSGEGIQNRSILTNQSNGQINIENAGADGIFNYFGSTFTNSGDLSINTAGWGLYNIGTVENTMQGDINIDNIDFQGIGNFVGTFLNSGDITIDNTDSHGIFTGSVFTNNGSITFGSSISANAVLILNGSTFDNSPTGQLNGEGTITGAGFTDNGGMAPGFSPGLFTIDGDWMPGASSNYDCEIAAAGNHDQIDVTGSATLDGTIDVTFINGYAPVAGDAFEVVTCNPCSGTFSAVNLPALAAGLLWKTSNLADKFLVEIEADDDLDGFSVSGGDCDDNDNTVYPNAPEICDGKDNDCNSLVDDGAGGATFIGNVVLNGQPAINAFLPCYAHIDGDLSVFSATDLSPLSNLESISGVFTLSVSPSLPDLSGLENLTSVGTDLNLQNSGFQNIDALSNLTSVGNDIRIINNSALQNLDGLSGLTALNHSLNVEENPLLENLTGLNQVTSIGGSLEIRDNPILANLLGLSQLASVADDLQLSDNHALQDLSGLEQITSIGGYLGFGNNDGLLSLDGLGTITTLGQLGIFNHDLLENIDALGSLASITGDFEIKNNDALPDLDALANLTSVGNLFTLIENDILSDCCGVHELLNTPGAIGGNINIFSNLTGCDSQPEVITYCIDADMDGFNIIDGDCDDNDNVIYPNAPEVCDGKDNDCNGLTDTDDPGFVDNTPPVITCMDITVALNADANLTIFPTDVYQSGSDDCGTVNLETVAPNSFTCQNEGANTVTLTANDGNGNTGTCTAIVTIEEYLTINSITETAESCLGAGNGSIVIDATAGGGQVGYSINGGTSFQFTDTFDNLTPGTYNIVVKVFNIANVCEKTATATVAEGPAPTTWYKDIDADGYTDGTTQSSCLQPTGYVASALSGDCNDNNAAINPGAAEICDGLDNDCDGNTPADEVDNDGDGYMVCEDDCDDNDPDVNPGATEVCNGIDDDCDGEIDEGLSGETYTGSISFSTQQQLDDWPACYSIIDGSLTIAGNGITDLSNLSNITEVTGSLTIYFNSSLASLDGLDNLATVGGSLTMFYNFSLSDCCAIYDLLENNGVTGTITIFLNLTGCNSEQNIKDTCAPPIPLVSEPGTPSNALSDAESLSVYPNPANGKFTVLVLNYFETGKLALIDTNGRQVIVQDIVEGQSVYQFEESNLSPSIYMVVLKSAGYAMQVKRLVIE